MKNLQVFLSLLLNYVILLLTIQKVSIKVKLNFRKNEVNYEERNIMSTSTGITRNIVYKTNNSFITVRNHNF